MTDASDTFTSVYLDDLQAEFPRIDDRRAGLANQHSWFAAGARSRRHLQQHSPCRQQDRQAQTLPAAAWGCHLRADVRAARGRCAGGRRMAAGEVDRGPVAIVELAGRVPFGLHGNWVPAAA